MIEVCHNVTPAPQPSPARNAGGDCFACAFAAAVSWLFPDRPVGLEQAWGYFMQETVGGNLQLSNTWPGLRRALYAARGDDYRMEIVADMVVPSFNPEMWSHAWWQAQPTTAYAHRLEGWLRGGWVAFTEIDFHGEGPRKGEYTNCIDHIVLLDGIRAAWERVDNLGSRMTYAVHVVCSARGVYWIDLDEFLRNYGGAAWWLCRKDIR